MATGQGIIEDALLDIGVGTPGDTLDQGVLNHGLRVLNRMWSSWGAELGPVYSITQDTYTWGSGAASKTIGATGDIAVARPIEIVSIQTRKDNLDYTVNRVSYEQYQTTVLKSVSTDYPDVWANSGTFPNDTIYLYPTPASSLTVYINSKKALTAFTMAGTISLPEGYEEAIQKNLTIELAPAHGKTVRSETVIRARNAKKAILAINDEPGELWPDELMPGVGSAENIDILTND